MVFVYGGCRSVNGCFFGDYYYISLDHHHHQWLSSPWEIDQIYFQSSADCSNGVHSRKVRSHSEARRRWAAYSPIIKAAANPCCYDPPFEQSGPASRTLRSSFLAFGEVPHESSAPTVVPMSMQGTCVVICICGWLVVPPTISSGFHTKKRQCRHQYCYMVLSLRYIGQRRCFVTSPYSSRPPALALPTPTTFLLVSGRR